MVEDDEDELALQRGTGQTRLRDASENYLEGCEGSTLDKNKAALEKLLVFCETRGVFFVEQLTGSVLTAQRKWLKSRISARTGTPLSAVTQRCYTVIIKHFLRDMLSCGLTRDVYYSYKLSRNVKSSIYVATTTSRKRRPISARSWTTFTTSSDFILVWAICRPRSLGRT